jgi:acetyltransferase-like isoleucine patch superfamily enzyme
MTKPDLTYYDDKFPLNRDIEVDINGIKNTVGKHTYGVELIKRFHYDNLASFHIGRFCAIAHAEFYLGGSKDMTLITSSFTSTLATKFFPNAMPGTNPSEDLDESVRNNIYLYNDVWIGNNSTIMHGVRIGNGAVIAANSHIVKDVPPYAIYGGNPGKLIRYRFNAAIIKLLLELSWWELEDEVINLLIPELTMSPNEYLLQKIISKVEGCKRSKCLFELNL